MCRLPPEMRTSYRVSGKVSKPPGVVDIADTDVKVDVQNGVATARGHDGRGQVKVSSICVVIALNWTDEVVSESSLDDLCLDCNHQSRMNPEINVKRRDNVQL